MKTENLETINDTRVVVQDLLFLRASKKSLHLIHASPHLARPTFVSAHLYLVRLLLFRCKTPMSATLQRVLCFGRLSEKSILLTVYEPKSLIEISSEHTPIDLPSRKGSLDTNLDDLATTVDASDVHDTTEMGQLTSPLFFLRSAT